MKSSLNDKFLVASSIAGDEEAFGKIYDKYVDEIYCFVFTRVKNNKEEAQDLTSETFLKAWQYVNSSEKMVENIRALLYKISRNLIIDNYRKNGNQLQSIDDSIVQTLADKSKSPQDATDQKMEVEKIISCLESLSQEAKEIITMRYMQDLSVSEISKILGKKAGAVRVALHRAKNQIKDQLKKK